MNNFSQSDETQKENQSERKKAFSGKSVEKTASGVRQQSALHKHNADYRQHEELFSDVLQQVMKAELSKKLGYEKSERVSDQGDTETVRNDRNGYSKKTVKTQPGEVNVKIPRDKNGEFEPLIIGKYARNADGMEEKILSYIVKAAYVVLGIEQNGRKDYSWRMDRRE